MFQLTRDPTKAPDEPRYVEIEFEDGDAGRGRRRAAGAGRAARAAQHDRRRARRRPRRSRREPLRRHEVARRLRDARRHACSHAPAARSSRSRSTARCCALREDLMPALRDARLQRLLVRARARGAAGHDRRHRASRSPAPRGSSCTRAALTVAGRKAPRSLYRPDIVTFEERHGLRPARRAAASSSSTRCACASGPSSVGWSAAPALANARGACRPRHQRHRVAPGTAAQLRVVDGPDAGLEARPAAGRRRDRHRARLRRRAHRRRRCRAGTARSCRTRPGSRSPISARATARDRRRRDQQGRRAAGRRAPDRQDAGPADARRRASSTSRRRRATGSARCTARARRCARCSRCSSARARSDAPILFLGESGTGKELVARGVHDAAPRTDGPFVVFDCGASTETLIESDLFGHTRARSPARRPIARARSPPPHGGTLFLDEIGDLPVALQPKLLRMLEAGEVIPLGGRKSERYDVRVVAATHRDVFGEVARGGFRGDLYYRLAVVEVARPAAAPAHSAISRALIAMLPRARRRAATSPRRSGGTTLERLAALPLAGQRARAAQRDHARGRARRPRRRLRSAADRAAPAPPPPPTAPPVQRRSPVPRGQGRAASRASSASTSTDLVQRARRQPRRRPRAIAGLERKFLYKLLERAGLRS